ncbi:MAG TPA: shikimate kinase [Gemmatimonadales bacterium]|nr:shikimate kinase [Gemmatimonadales bacterium]HRX18983.1 shikimate kinase [Gemmatimonadales bacterium]
MPGAGKSTVAPLVAAALGTSHRDLDQWIEADAGRTIPELFATEGEAAFRDRERVAMAAALAESPMVISPGGGWAAEPGNLALAEPRALTLYLYVSPEVAAGRLGPATDRPLLRDAPLPRLRELLDRRERWYRLAGIEIDAEGAPEVVAAGVVVAARRYGGW